MATTSARRAAVVAPLSRIERAFVHGVSGRPARAWGVSAKSPMSPTRIGCETAASAENAPATFPESARVIPQPSLFPASAKAHNARSGLRTHAVAARPGQGGCRTGRPPCPAIPLTSRRQPRASRARLLPTRCQSSAPAAAMTTGIIALSALIATDAEPIGTAPQRGPCADAVSQCDTLGPHNGRRQAHRQHPWHNGPSPSDCSAQRMTLGSEARSALLGQPCSGDAGTMAQVHAQYMSSFIVRADLCHAGGTMCGG